jgi:hypothetical protein
MHHLAECTLKAGEAEDQLSNAASLRYEFDGQQHVIACQEWGPHVTPYVSGVRSLVKDRGPQATPMYERRVTITPDCWGTADAMIVTARGTAHARLDVVDLKTGRHIVPPNAPQLLTYAVGACEEWGWEWPGGVWLHRWQRWADEPHACMRVEADTLRQHKDRIHWAVNIARAGGEPTGVNINPECRFCLRVWPTGAVGKAGCPAHTQRALDILAHHDVKPDQTTGRLAKPDPADMPIDKLSALLPVAQEIIDWLQGVLAYGNQRAEEGQEFLGMKTVLSSPKRSWRKDMSEEEVAEQVAAVGAMLEKDVDPWVQKLAPLTKIEYVLGEKSIDHLVQKPPPRRKLVPDTDEDTRVDVGNRLALLTEDSIDA